MGFKWQQYVELAGELISGRFTNTSRQARHRAAISRAYYGAFIPTRDAMQRRLSKCYGRVDVHAAVRKDLESSESQVCNDIGLFLATMARRRKNADYEADWREDDQETALDQLSKANKVLELLDKV